MLVCISVLVVYVSMATADDSNLQDQITALKSELKSLKVLLLRCWESWIPLREEKLKGRYYLTRT